MCSNSGCVRWHYYDTDLNNLLCRFLWAFSPSCLSDLHLKFKSVVKCAYFVKDLSKLQGPSHRRRSLNFGVPETRVVIFLCSVTQGKQDILPLILVFLSL